VAVEQAGKQAGLRHGLPVTGGLFCPSYAQAERSNPQKSKEENRHVQQENKKEIEWSFIRLLTYF